ncbi:hypothetical protein GCM10023160_11560 [Brachybacterium paraconglomeratum]
MVLRTVGRATDPPGRGTELEGERATCCLWAAQVPVQTEPSGGKLGMCDGSDLVGESGFDREWHADGTSGHRSWRSRRISASHQGGRGLGILREQELGLLSPGAPEARTGRDEARTCENS